MSLGIKRECIGDIVFNNGKAFFAATNEISSFLLEEFRFVGKTPMELKLIDYEVKNIINYEFKTHFLASIRLDSIVANGFNISRTIAQEMIMEGLVYINHVLCQNTSHEVKVDDQIISIDDEMCSSRDDVAAAIANHEVGDTVSIVVVRENKMKTVKATLAEYKGQTTEDNKDNQKSEDKNVE